MSSASSPLHAAPDWLTERLQAAGGWVAFSTYMDWVLHDPSHGAYGAGRLQVGTSGDFATSPSLGPDFAELLLPQLLQWFEQQPGHGPLALIETGPGEGHLALQLSSAIAREAPELLERLELVLVEPNPGMAERQRALLAEAPLRCSWQSFAQLKEWPRAGVMLAHEVLDALAVERVLWDGQCWRLQGVSLVGSSELELAAGPPLSESLRLELEVLIPGPQRPAGWCTELHVGVGPWLEQAASSLSQGQLLVIDYAHEAWRYYALQRSNGTLMAYRQQQASDDPLQEPGQWDLTAHLCLETVERAAAASGWRVLGQRRQGEALLALGLAQRLHALQQGSPAELADLLSRREALLRYVDPSALGDFRWIALQRSAEAMAQPLFLQDPPLG